MTPFPEITNDPWLAQQVAFWLKIANDFPESAAFYQACALGMQIRLQKRSWQEEIAIGKAVLTGSYESAERKWVSENFKPDAQQTNQIRSLLSVVIFRLTDELHDLHGSIHNTCENRDLLEGALLVFEWSDIDIGRNTKYLKRLDQIGSVTVAKIPTIKNSEQLQRARELFNDWWWVQNIASV